MKNFLFQVRIHALPSKVTQKIKIKINQLFSSRVTGKSKIYNKHKSTPNYKVFSDGAFRMLVFVGGSWGLLFSSS